MAIFADCSDGQPIEVNQNVYGGFVAAEQERNLNMYDIKDTIQFLKDNGFTDSVQWLRMNQPYYVCGVKNGFVSK